MNETNLLSSMYRGLTLLCIDRVLGIQSIQQSSFQDSTKVFQNEIPNYFPNFREMEGEVTLIFKPDLFLKSTELQEYQKN